MKITSVIIAALAAVTPVFAVEADNSILFKADFEKSSANAVFAMYSGTAKGGVAVAIAKEMNIPIMYIGVGEGIDDLRPFDAEDFAKNII